MPYKFDEGRRHKFAKARYRVTNWPDYDAALARRGELTVWLTDEAIAAWHAPATGERGGQPIYSTIAIETALTLRLVFHQPLRQTEGLLRSIAAPRWCANGLRSEPSSWLLQSPFRTETGIPKLSFD